MKKILIKGNSLGLPCFFPDATRGVVRTLDSKDIENAGIDGVVVNTFHLMQEPGSSTLQATGGLKILMNWQRFMISDSGGFQIFSMIYQNPSLGKIDIEGAKFKYKGRSYSFAPEDSIRLQFEINSDILICLDDCAPVNASKEELKLSVERTVEWARRCKAEFESQAEKRGLDHSNRPLLFGVIQGGNDLKLRKLCADELIKIGFDGFGFGGWPLDKDREVDYEILKFTAELMPDHLPKYALGLGNPDAVVKCFQFGYNIFDCVLPTRDARHARLYVFPASPEGIDLRHVPTVHRFLYINDEQHRRDRSPISEFCDCYTCKNFSKAYLHHLFNIGDISAHRLATIHNLAYYAQLMKNLQKYE